MFINNELGIKRILNWRYPSPSAFRLLFPLLLFHLRKVLPRKELIRYILNSLFNSSPSTKIDAKNYPLVTRDYDFLGFFKKLEFECEDGLTFFTGWVLLITLWYLLFLSLKTTCFLCVDVI